MMHTCILASQIVVHTRSVNLSQHLLIVRTTNGSLGMSRRPNDHHADPYYSDAHPMAVGVPSVPVNGNIGLHRQALLRAPKKRLHTETPSLDENLPEEHGGGKRFPTEKKNGTTSLTTSARKWDSATEAYLIDSRHFEKLERQAFNLMHCPLCLLIVLGRAAGEPTLGAWVLGCRVISTLNTALVALSRLGQRNIDLLVQLPRLRACCAAHVRACRTWTSSR
jgi:hypothetical protein